MNLRIVLLAFAVLFACTAQAHSVSTSYIQVTENASERIAVQVDLSLRDLDAVVNLDPDQNSAITWSEVVAATTDIERYVTTSLTVSRGSHECNLSPQQLLVDEHADGPYAVVLLVGRCVSEGKLAVHSNLFYEIDLSQRTLLTVVHSNQPSNVTVLTSDTRDWVATDVNNSFASRVKGELQSLLRFIVQGIWHIWTGYDHLAFLLLLLLPAVMARQDDSSTRLVRRLLGVITAFTAAHSITLALAALGYIKLPTRFTEASIAASIVISGFVNLHLKARNLGAFAAFGFGLIHGFGFASALADLSLTAANRVTALVGFNLGVEVGQLAVVSITLPILLRLRRARWYPRWFIPLASLSLSTLGSIWFWQRAFG